MTGIRFTTHDLRYSFATKESEKKINEHVLQDIMGHNDPKTTHGYVKMCTKSVVAEVMRADLTEDFNLDCNFKIC
jgi:integrase